MSLTFCCFVYMNFFTSVLIRDGKISHLAASNIIAKVQSILRNDIRAEGVALAGRMWPKQAWNFHLEHRRLSFCTLVHITLHYTKWLALSQNTSCPKPGEGQDRMACPHLCPFGSGEALVWMYCHAFIIFFSTGSYVSSWTLQDFYCIFSKHNIKCFKNIFSYLACHTLPFTFP